MKQNPSRPGRRITIMALQITNWLLQTPPVSSTVDANQGAAHLSAAGKTEKLTLSGGWPGHMHLDEDARRIYASGDATAIRELENKAAQDLDPVHAAIAAGGMEVFIPVQAEGCELYVSHVPNVKTASSWIMVTTSQKDSNERVSRKVVVGNYSSTAGIINHKTWSFDSFATVTTGMILGAIVEAIVWKRVSIFAGEISRAVFNKIVNKIGEKLAKGVYYITEYGIKCAPGLLVTLAFQGVVWFGVRCYAITYKFRNFDDRPWKVAKIYDDNIQLNQGVSLEGTTVEAQIKQGTCSICQ